MQKGKITDLIQDDRNANRHSERGKELLQKSINELGAGRSVLVDSKNVLIAGNATAETAASNGITKTIVVETEGDTLVVVKRTDLDLNDPGESGRKARQMALVDNSSALLGINFDFEVAQEIGNDFEFEVSEWGIEIPTQIEEPGYDELIGENKDKPPTLKVTFPTPEDLQKCESHIQEVLNRLCPNAFYSVSAGEI